MVLASVAGLKRNDFPDKLKFNLLIFLHKLKTVLRLQFRDEFTKNIQLLPWLDGIYNKCSSTSFTASLKSGRHPEKDPFLYIVQPLPAGVCAHLRSTLRKNRSSESKKQLRYFAEREKR